MRNSFGHLAGAMSAAVLVAVLLMIATPATAEEPGPQAVVALVTRVVDGDTIYAMIGNRLEAIRYIGVNTPEVHHPRLGQQPGGLAASEVNRQIVDGQWVTLTFDVQQRDRYGRLLAYVWINGQLVNAQLVHRGYAQAATYPPNVRYADYFQQLERGAREDQRGLWGDASAEPVLRHLPKWARPRRPMHPSGRALLPGEIPPHDAVKFKASDSESSTSRSHSMNWPAGLAYPDGGGSCPGGEYVGAYTHEDGTNVRAYCRRR